jgi:hypothetical protein
VSGARSSEETEVGKLPEPDPTRRAMRENPLLAPPNLLLLATMSMVTSLRRLDRLARLLLALAGIAEGEVPAVDWAAVDR